MATLQSIGVTLGAGSIVLVVSVGLFGMAIRRQTPLIAPRATARPRNVIYHPTPTNRSQDRGSPFVGWVGWTLGLTYETMLRGVPGTGTRNDGLGGMPLKVNLDGIVLLKFHAFCRRVSLVASLLYILFLLPVYYTARCASANNGSDSTDPHNSSSYCSSDNYNLTNYERTTIMNVPSANLKTLTESQRSASVARLYAASLVYLVLVLYVLYLLDKVYVTLLAMRRVYYLEHDVWDERRQELKQTMLYDECATEEHRKKQHFTFEEEEALRQLEHTHHPEPANQELADNPHQSAQSSQGKAVRFGALPSATVTVADAQSHPQQQPPLQPKQLPRPVEARPIETLDKHMVMRDPWIPHPEQRETIPNVSLYSVLVGGLPSIPEHLLDTPPPTLHNNDNNDTDVWGKRTNLDWQLELTSQIFDLCVPNQPGFSSSVAAVTIIPGANDMTHAWRKWYTAASKMRRLEFLRKEIAHRRAYDIVVDGDSDDDNDVELQRMHPQQQGTQPTHKSASTPGHDDADADHSDDAFHSTSQMLETEPPKTVADPRSQNHPDEDGVISPRPIYRGLSKRQSYFRQIFGSTMQLELERDVAQALALGPEQAAVYSRELAQSAAPCCPVGCREDRIRTARIDDLIAMEREAAEDLHAANLALNEIRRKITVTIENPDDPRKQRSTHGNKPNLSFEGDQIPADLSLEAQLYKRNSKHNTDASQSALCDSASNRRASPFRAALRPRSADSNLWQHVEAIVSEAQHTDSRTRTKSADVSSTSERSSVETGEWHLPSLKRFQGRLRNVWYTVREWTMRSSTGAVDAVARDSTYAVVTFTSRQAAVAARMCLADGRGQERWKTVREIPIPPLADAAACEFMACRNCFRPVTISINDRQKNGRKYLAFAILGCIYVFYTVPLTFAANVANAGQLTQIAPNLANWVNSLGLSVSGIVSSALYSLFFSLCPTMFKAIANFGSNAVSVAHAEHIALQYYWWFMVLTAFSSTLLTTMVIDAFNENLAFGSEFRSVLGQISETIPSTISVTWLNWIIFRFTITLPLNYLLQINSFIFSALGWKCCARLMMGGGPGGPTPYRIYIDSGVVLMCILALAPASPLVALAGFAYFVIIEPLLRRNLIFVYRPKFDGGGARWDFIFEMIISAIVVGVVFLTAQMILRAAIGPAVIAALTLVPTILYQWHAKAKYKRAFDDCALLQTALLDGWDTERPLSEEQREEFRKWLIDAHKAAYVPVCLFGLDTLGCLTSEPAVVIPMETETDVQDDFIVANADESSAASVRPLEHQAHTHQYQHTTQLGATFRRSVHTIALLRKTMPVASDNASVMTAERFTTSAPVGTSKRD